MSPGAILSPIFEAQRENNMRNLHGGDVVAGWTVAQWITVLRASGVPTPFTSHSEAMDFRLEYLQTRDQPAAYAGKDLEVELIEASLILESAR
jgi:hypothetical protein